MSKEQLDWTGERLKGKGLSREKEERQDVWREKEECFEGKRRVLGCVEGE